MAPKKNKASPKNPSINGISRITISGFKSIYAETAVDIRPLTVLAGPNSSGKSSIMQPLLLLKQTLEAQYDPGSLQIDGTHVKFTKASEFLSKAKDGGEPSRAMTIQVDVANEFTKLTFAKGSDGPIEVEEVARRGLVHVIGEKLELREWRIGINDSSEVLRNTFKAAKRNLPFLETKGAELSVLRDRCFLIVNATMQFEKGGPVGTFSVDLGMRDFARREILRMIHLPGLRGIPERTYPLVPTGRVFPGLFQNYAASVIHKWAKNNETTKLDELNEALDFLDLQSNISTDAINETQVAVWVSRTRGSATDRVSIADVGLAVSQVLPVLVALIVAEPGQLVYIEQPEIHLHPRAQWMLARLLIHAANRGVQLVIETHSSLLLRGIQTCVAKNEIRPGGVALHWFQRGKNGTTTVATAELDEDGGFGEWPADFDLVDLTSDNEYLDAVEGKLMGIRG